MNRAHRALLRLAPRPLRDHYGRDMEELFTERLAAARASGSSAVAAVCVRSSPRPSRLVDAGPRHLPVYIDAQRMRE